MLVVRIAPKMGTPSPVELPRSFEDLRGRVFQQRYSVTELLTVGRSHVVFAATDRKGAGQVLLRVMRPSLLHDPPTVARFEQRVQSARRASSLRARPSIDAGVGKDGKLYLVCKRPPGRSLQHLVAEREHGRLSWPIAKQVLQSLVEVLAAAHDRRIVHGGMTPDSFWIEEPEGTGPVAYVVDLGANPEVRLDDEAAEPVRTTALTADMEFTAPETITHATYDPRTDVYLLGLLAYFMLAGRPPFSGSNQFQVASLQLQHAVPPLHAVVPGVPEGVEALIGSMLAKEPAQRLQTMGEVGRALMGVSELIVAGARGHVVASPRVVMPPRPSHPSQLSPVVLPSAPVLVAPEPTEIFAPARELVDATEVLCSSDVGSSDATTVLAPSELGDYTAPPAAATASTTVTSRQPEPISASPWRPLVPHGTPPNDEPRAVRPAPPGVSPLRPQAQLMLPPPPALSTPAIPWAWILLAFGVVIAAGAAVGMWLAR